MQDQKCLNPTDSIVPDMAYGGALYMYAVVYACEFDCACVSACVFVCVHVRVFQHTCSKAFTVKSILTTSLHNLEMFEYEILFLGTNLHSPSN